MSGAKSGESDYNVRPSVRSFYYEVSLCFNPDFSPDEL